VAGALPRPSRSPAQQVIPAQGRCRAVPNDDRIGKTARQLRRPPRGRITVEAWSRRWIATQGHLKPSTRARYEGVLSKQIVPR
jgi:hypothetical protein